MERRRPRPPDADDNTRLWWAGYWRWKRRHELTRRMRVRVFRETGDLYAGRDWYHVEQEDIRSEIEEQGGIPMGYGRVGRLPIQLDDDEAQAQFNNTRNVGGYDGERDED